MPEGNIFGEIVPPQAVRDYDAQASSVGAESIGLILLFSNLIKLFTVVAGLYVLYNFIYAGYLYITGSGDSGAHAKVKEKLTWSVMGLAVIVLSYTIIGIIGLVFFGNAGFILSPEIIGPATTSNPVAP